MARLRAVLFDIDDTLFSTTHFARVARKNAIWAMIRAGLDVTEEEALRELEEVISEFSSNYAHHFDQLLRRLRQPTIEERNPALIVAAGVAAYHDTKFRQLEPFPDVCPLLEALRAAGIQVGILTHGWTTKQAEKIVRLGLLDCVHPKAVFISEQIGISKPNPKLYAQALADLELAPGEVMYVGDNPTHDIAPPQSLGMIAVWAKRAAKDGLEGTGIEPDHVVENFDELRTILRETYEIAV
ncbi:MAG: haloacid dehalogenase [Planctomycetes bacterium]|jgi:putative hydrolase of the HAD superfamily|nr:haloacid dehalogenase [Planctomycetota bacterium]